MYFACSYESSSITSIQLMKGNNQYMFGMVSSLQHWKFFKLLVLAVDVKVLGKK